MGVGTTIVGVSATVGVGVGVCSTTVGVGVRTPETVYTPSPLGFNKIFSPVVLCVIMLCSGSKCNIVGLVWGMRLTVKSKVAKRVSLIDVKPDALISAHPRLTLTFEFKFLVS